MRPVDVQQIGQELAIKWEDNSESFIPLERLRRACPCAGCKGEVDVLGQSHRGPEIKLFPASFKLQRITSIGGYAVQPVWADGHASGLYPFELLMKLALSPNA
jgi:DUF971 family protein